MLQSGEPVVASLSRSALQGTGESSQAANERRDGAPFQRWANSDFHTLFFFVFFFPAANSIVSSPSASRQCHFTLDHGMTSKEI